MRYTLKDYQSDAVEQLLDRLAEARSDFRSFGKRSSVSLCATTGAGKTVMSAAVIEALFDGSDEFEFDPDPGAVVIWFSDDPSLNEQTKNRLMAASDKLGFTDLVTIEPPFDKPRLDPGKVYFLNTQKLSVTSKLTRGAQLDAVDDMQDTLTPQQPDDQAWTIWETISNTIKDPNLTVYLFLDEAHRGFGKRQDKAKSTIVSRLVGGSSLVEPAPIVVGISATIGKFSTAMSEADFSQDRRALAPVNVDGARVQESGLLKDTVVLDFTTEHGVFDRALVRRAAEKLKSSAGAWAEYAKSQNDPSAAVVPLLVLQIPNKPDHSEVGASLDLIASIVPELTQGAVRHVLGEHKPQDFGSWTVNWMEPQLVQGRTDVRVLIAKEAISTGWDCPRAEVMVSFRTAKETDHITQILGRMVRNPLARRVPGDERLNSVDCILPYFDRTTAGKVVKFLTGQIESVPGTEKRILVDGREMRKNPHFPDDHPVWDAWRAMPTDLLPQRGVNPVSRTLQFATELENDTIELEAVNKFELLVIKELGLLGTRFERELTKARDEIQTIRGMSIAGTTGEQSLSYTDFTMVSDDQAVAIAFKDAGRAFSDVARRFVTEHVAGHSDDFDDPTRDAMIEIAAMATTPQIRAGVEKVANETFKRWVHQNEEQVNALSDLRRERYRDIKAQAPDPQQTNLTIPRVRLEDFQEVDENENTRLADLVGKHLMSDDDGNFPLTRLNMWERRVVQHELTKSSTVAWYRNPPRSSGDSLCIAYRNEFGNWRGMYPDFIFFENVEGHIKPSIVDPHRFDLDDALRKLRALSRFAKEHGDQFQRIISVAEVSGKLYALDCQREMVQGDIEYWKQEDSLDNLYSKSGQVITADKAPVDRESRPLQPNTQGSLLE